MPKPEQFKSHEEYLQWYRDYRAKNRKHLRKYNAEYNSLWRKKNGYHSEKKWKKNNKDKCRAQEKARYALEKGILRKGVCEMCGDKKAVMHHPDYTKPLFIQWLCRIHHSEIHYTKSTYPHPR